MSRFGNRPTNTNFNNNDDTTENKMDDDIVRRFEIQRLLKFFGDIINMVIAGKISAVEAQEIIEKSKKDAETILTDTIGIAPPQLVEDIASRITKYRVEGIEPSLDHVRGALVVAAREAKTIWKGNPPTKDFPYSDRGSMVLSILQMSARVEQWCEQQGIDKVRRYFVEHKIAEASHQMAESLINTVDAKKRDQYNLMQSCMRNISEALSEFVPENGRDKSTQAMNFIEEYAKRLSENVILLIEDNILEASPSV